MKKTMCLVLVLMMCLSFGVFSASAEGIELTYLHDKTESERATNPDNEVFYTILEQWQSEHPEITLDQSGMYQADYVVKIQAQAAADDLPDIFMLKGSWVSTFVDNDLVLPLNEYIDALEYKDAYRDGIFDAATRDGIIYGNPFQYAITSVVFYNMELWAQAGYDTFPKTWDEIFAANEKFKEMGIYTLALGNVDKWQYESCILSALGDRFTGTAWTDSIVANDGNAKFTDPEFVQALELTQKMATEGFFNPDYNTINHIQANNYLAEGKAATNIDGYWAIGNLETILSPEMIDKIGVAVLPAVDGGKGDADATSGGCGWYVALNSKLEGERLEAALDLLFSLTGVEYSETLTGNYGVAGACVVDDVDMSQFSILTQRYIDTTNQCAFTPIYDIHMDGAVIEVMNAGAQELLNSTITPEQLAEDIQAEQDSL